eukprot:scaffold12.g8034.t1
MAAAVADAAGAAAAAQPAAAPAGARAEIVTHESPSLVYALGWSARPDRPFRLAVGSFIEDYNNRVEILQLDEASGALVSPPKLSFTHPYPPTKIMWVPDKDCSRRDLLATAGDFLRLWAVGPDGVKLEKLLSNNKGSDQAVPVTSFDWHEADPRRIGASSIDTTCTIWDVERGIVDTQLIAHDREVYDIAWGGVGVFASVSADGSVRVFDLRDKEHSTIIYECPTPNTPLLRLSWNKQASERRTAGHGWGRDPRYMAVLTMDSSKVGILDIRFPTLPVAELQRHSAQVNAVCWAPHSAAHLCSAGDDGQALIWDVSSIGPLGQPVERALEPILAYSPSAEINQLQWSGLQPDWVGICFGNKTQILRV